MGKSRRAYKSAKRSKELARLKKQEEKRKKRFGKDEAPLDTEKDDSDSQAETGENDT